jgi:hypothetical protein
MKNKFLLLTLVLSIMGAFLVTSTVSAQDDGRQFEGISLTVRRINTTTVTFSARVVDINGRGLGSRQVTFYVVDRNNNIRRVGYPSYTNSSGSTSITLTDTATGYRDGIAATALVQGNGIYITSNTMTRF